MPEHTAPPYRIGGGGNLIAKDDGDEFTIAFVRASPWGDNDYDALQANAEFIVRACNEHEALVRGIQEVLALNRKQGSPLGDYGRIAHLAVLARLDEFVPPPLQAS